MCTHYKVTGDLDAMRRAFGVSSEHRPNLPAFGDIYPGREGPVVRTNAEGQREIATMLWGFPPPDGSRQPVVNIRNLASPFWRTWLARPAQRCLVPVERFAEWTSTPDPVTRRKRQVWFAMKDEGETPFAFAGLWRPGLSPQEPPRYAFLTTMANNFVASIHPKAMPVILAREHYDQWMEGSTTDATALARACPDRWLTIVEPPAA